MMVEEINKCIEVLKSGGTILYPTDTIWGIGCDATNKNAVEKIFKIKQREESKTFIVLVDRIEMLNKYIKEVPAIAWDLIETTDTPLTIIYDGAINLAPNAIAEDGSIAIRITSDEFCKKLIYRLGKPIVSTSANTSGESTPQNFMEVNPYILKAVDHVVEWRQNDLSKSIPSSIIRIKENGEFKIIRK